MVVVGLVQHLAVFHGLKGVVGHQLGNGVIQVLHLGGGQGVVVDAQVVQHAVEGFPAAGVQSGADIQFVVIHLTAGHTGGNGLAVDIEGAGAGRAVLHGGHQEPFIQRGLHIAGDVDGVAAVATTQVDLTAAGGIGQADAVPAGGAVQTLAENGHPVTAIILHFDPGGDGEAVGGGEVQLVGVSHGDEVGIGLGALEPHAVAHHAFHHVQSAVDGAVMVVVGLVQHLAVHHFLEGVVGDELLSRRLHRGVLGHPEVVHVGVGALGGLALVGDNLNLQGVFLVLQHAALEDAGAEHFGGLVGVNGFHQGAVDVNLRLAVLILHTAEDFNADAGKGQIHGGALGIVVVAGAVITLGVFGIHPEAGGILHPGIGIVDDFPIGFRAGALLGLDHLGVDGVGYLGRLHLLDQNGMLAVFIGSPGVGAVGGIDGDGALLDIPIVAGTLHGVNQAGQVPALAAAGGVAEIEVVALADGIVSRHQMAGVAGNDVVADFPAAPHDGHRAVGFHIDGGGGVKAHIVLAAGGEIARHDGAQLDLLGHQLDAG